MARAKILEEFARSLHLEVTKDTLSIIRTLVQKYELRDQHMYALNTPYLGLYDVFFFATDKDRLYDVFDITHDNIKDAIKPLTVNNDPINPSWQVSSEPFNLFCVWVMHKTINSKLSTQDTQELLALLMRYLHYSFFSSLSNRRFQHKPNEGVMRATIESLSGKPGIVQHGTWRKVIEHRSDFMTDPKSGFYRNLKHFGPDPDVLRVITDAQTSIRSMINTVTGRFYELLEEKRTIDTYGTIDSVDGEKVLKDTVGMVDQLTTRLGNDVLSGSDFIDGAHIKLLCGINKELKPSMFRQLLNRYIDLANHQSKRGTLDEISTIKKEQYYTGHRILVMKIVEVTYHYLVNNKVNMSNKFEIMKATQNAYRSSQLADEDLLMIKRSVGLLIDNFPGTTRANTKTILRASFITYVILLSFKYL